MGKDRTRVFGKDFDFSRQSLSINKTWDYKGEGGFLPTKNQSSIRKIQIDWHLIIQFSTLVKELPEDEPIFIEDKVYNSTVNEILARHCRKIQVPIIQELENKDVDLVMRSLSSLNCSIIYALMER